MDKTRRRLRQPPAATADTEAAEARIIKHPDGYYWLADLHEVGPFATLDDARADMQAAEMEEPGVEPGESLAEAEADIGVAGWIDPDTGAPAEEQRPHLEDH